MILMILMMMIIIIMMMCGGNDECKEALDIGLILLASVMSQVSIRNQAILVMVCGRSIFRASPRYEQVR